MNTCFLDFYAFGSDAQKVLEQLRDRLTEWRQGPGPTDEVIRSLPAKFDLGGVAWLNHYAQGQKGSVFYAAEDMRAPEALFKHLAEWAPPKKHVLIAVGVTLDQPTVGQGWVWDRKHLRQKTWTLPNVEESKPGMDPGEYAEALAPFHLNRLLSLPQVRATFAPHSRRPRIA